ncbi:SIR2 family protein [Cupriavidus necator]
MVTEFLKNSEHLRRLLDTARQYWLLGAGVSFESNIPLMYPLTTRVDNMLDGDPKRLFAQIRDQLQENCHVEHVLSHLGDLIAIAARVRDGAAVVGEERWDLNGLKGAYRDIISHIGTTVRYGYRAANGTEPEECGEPGRSIVKLDAHLEFVRALFENRSNLEPRSNISFFTTNYDTLLEDALCLQKRIPIDGFEGSAIGYWNPLGSEQKRLSAQSNACPVYKLHGSVDWVNDPTYGLIRCRYDVRYLSSSENLLIYPQATKYVETQKDPFAHLFGCFRSALAVNESHVLAVAGYSFGDDHINNEIDLALASTNKKTNLVAFVKELNINGTMQLPPQLELWRQDGRMKARVYIASDKALYWNGERYAPDDGADLLWWSFNGMTEFLREGSVK